MKVNGKHFRTVWLKDDDNTVVQIIDQRFLPHQFVIEDITTVDEAATAIREMHVRGAPLIGAMAAYGMYLACLEHTGDSQIVEAAEKLKATRPTAIDLAWAVERLLAVIQGAKNRDDKIAKALRAAQDVNEKSVRSCQLIGHYGMAVIESISKRKGGKVVNILTHCNAGWLACVDHGTATAPIYASHDNGIALHVWVDETRPRNQGARLTAWELEEHGVPYTVIPDNVGGHLMQHGMVDLVIVGSDRTTYTGDVANKIGTYLKALAASDNDVPFYVALPSSSIDWTIRNGIEEIPIEQRSAEEVKYISGLSDGAIQRVLLTPKNSPVANYGFDVTPSRLVTALITERGICAANEGGILDLFPEHKKGPM